MSEIAGKIATQAGAFMLEKPLGGRGILLGGVPGVPAATVMIIGGGVVGMNAAFIAIGMEADVFVYDISIDRLRELDIALSGRCSTVYSSTLAIEEMLPRADLVIGAVLVHGARAPVVIRREQLALMKRGRGARGRLDRPGRLLRDVAADDPQRPHLRGRRRHALLRGEHARRGADHLDLRAHERDAALRAGAGGPRRRGAMARDPGLRPASTSPAGASRTRPSPRASGCLSLRWTRSRSPRQRLHDRTLPNRERRRRWRPPHRRPRSRTSSTASTRDAAEGGSEPILNPATGEQIATAPLSGEADVDAAVAGGEGAPSRSGPRRRRASGRSRCCKIADALEENAEELSRLESLNVGKPIEAMREEEMPFLVDNLRFFAGAARMPARAARRASTCAATRR